MTKKIELTDKQKDMIKALRKYPDTIIVRLHNECFLTGGHGVDLDRRTLNSLEAKGLVDYEQLTELGKSINIEA